ncbi:UDP-2,3-diacylglucosamine diphosphatase [Pedobacter mucosus]|uniref:UDP-2,3-diacylglucosamine diphosphatase n=1 Tax=Pedobacter mucosus TaxID=2895286 RepID=UPI001EE43F2C|nr:UDP-2,3-diacylglucosamine diphosphatase [Pedobacter mucosus]UKT63388.1 UDP-2,3-diacylglucosamine diphosphatase [Pedobacter mucosus]
MNKNIYFASDFHLGSPNYTESRAREARIVSWLNFIEPNCSELFLMGDIFDFWFEYAKVIPKGFIRLQGKLAAMADSGIKIYFFKGNHDMWVRDYFTQEIGMEIISDELVIERGGKKFYLHHGDGLGPGDRKYKFLRKIFRSGICQWLFARIHPNFGIALASAWSQDSRSSQKHIEVSFDDENEWLATYAKEVLQKQHYDYFVFGHRHIPLDIDLGKNSRYVNIGEWINYNSYGVFDGVTLKLEYYKPY